MDQFPFCSTSLLPLTSVPSLLFLCERCELESDREQRATLLLGRVDRDMQMLVSEDELV